MSDHGFLDVRGLVLSYGEIQALSGVDIVVERGRTLAIVGPSGCGKSTLLRVIAGLQTPENGTVTLNGHNLSGVPTFRRGIGLMFQDHALFPHLDVAANVGFGLRMKRTPKDERRDRIAEMLSVVGLETKATNAVQTLSGGEQQRVALARTLAPDPELVLLDEPMGSLDRALRERLAADVADIFATVGATAVFVTHDQAEAAVIGHEVAVMCEGRILQVGSPRELWESPVDEWTARFLGQNNLLDGSLVGAHAARVMLRPEKLHLVGQHAGVLSGEITSATFVAGEWHVRVSTKAGELAVYIPGDVPEPSGRVGIALSDGAVVPLTP